MGVYMGEIGLRYWSVRREIWHTMQLPIDLMPSEY
jgi:hypothetical protein